MRWRREGDTYLGPDGKAKIYIGSEDDTDAIVEARRLNRNYRKWRALMSDRRRLENWIASMEYDLREFRRRADTLLERSEKTPDIPELDFVANKLPGLELDKAA